MGKNTKGGNTDPKRGSKTKSNNYRKVGSRTKRGWLTTSEGDRNAVKVGEEKLKNDKRGPD